MVSLRLAALAVAVSQACTAMAQIPGGLQVRSSDSDARELALTLRKVEDVDELGDEMRNPTQQQTPMLNVTVSTSFPQSEFFGVKLVNGHATQAILDISNNEPEPITVLIIGGSLTTPFGVPGAPDPPVVLRNLTGQRYNVQIPAAEKQSVTYAFATEMHPQELQLNLATVLQNNAGAIYTKGVYNETVSIVEAPISVFDPQM